METKINFLTAIITLLSTVISVLKEKHSIKKSKKEKPYQSQNQNIYDISTMGDNSHININAYQNQSAYDLSPIEYEKIRQKEFSEKFRANRILLNIMWFFIILSSILISSEISPDNQINLTMLNAMSIIIAFIFSISFGLIILRVVQQFISSYRYSINENNILAKFIRFLQFYIAPLLAFLSLLFIYIFVSNNSSWVQNNYSSMYGSLFIFYLILLFISFYLYNYLSNLIFLYNIKKLSFRKKNGKHRQLQVLKKIGFIFILFIISSILLYYYRKYKFIFFAYLRILQSLIS